MSAPILPFRPISLPPRCPSGADGASEMWFESAHQTRPVTRSTLGDSAPGDVLPVAKIDLTLMAAVVSIGILIWVGVGYLIVDHFRSDTSLVIQAQHSERGKSK